VGLGSNPRLQSPPTTGVSGWQKSLTDRQNRPSQEAKETWRARSRLAAKVAKEPNRESKET
jgi:hypothetical protein